MAQISASPNPGPEKRGHSSRSWVSPPLRGLWDGGMAEGQRGFPDPDTGSVLQPGPRDSPWQSSSSTADRMEPFRACDTHGSGRRPNSQARPPADERVLSRVWWVRQWQQRH